MSYQDERPLEGKRVAMPIAPMFEDIEAYYPFYRLQEAGAEVRIVGLEAGQEVKGKWGTQMTTEVAASDVSSEEVDILVLPGGFGPDKLRTDDDIRRLTREVDEQGKPIAFICHAGWIPASAGIVAGRRVTTAPAIADDMVNAGAEWEDSEVVVDGNLVSSRRPPDLPAFLRSLIEVATRSLAPA